MNYQQVERDISRDDCNGKRKQFFDCVLSKKNELTQKLSDREWVNYQEMVNSLNLKCYEDGGMKKCENFFSLFDLKY